MKILRCNNANNFLWNIFLSPCLKKNIFLSHQNVNCKYQRRHFYDHISYQQIRNSFLSLDKRAMCPSGIFKPSHNPIYIIYIYFLKKKWKRNDDLLLCMICPFFPNISSNVTFNAISIVHSSLLSFFISKLFLK